MVLPVFSWTVFTLVAAPNAAVVVALDNAPETLDASRGVAARMAQFAGHVLSSTVISERLGCTPAARPRDIDRLRQMLDDARRLEARFDTPAANALRHEVLRGFDETVRPGRTLRLLASRAAFDIAAGLLGESDRDGAVVAAREAVRRFPNERLDSAHYPPSAIAFFRQQERALTAGEQMQLTVRSDESGEIYADGRFLGNTNGELRAELPVGAYSIWLESKKGISLPHAVKSGGGPLKITIDFDLERRIVLTDVVTFDCQRDCATPLRRLGRRLGADKVLAVTNKGLPVGHGTAVSNRGGAVFRLLEVDVSSGHSTESVIDGQGHKIDLDLVNESPQAMGRLGFARALKKPLPWVVVGVAMASVGGATYFGVRSSERFDEAARPETSPRERESLNQEGKDSAIIANGLVGLAGASFAGVAIILLIDARTQAPSAESTADTRTHTADADRSTVAPSAWGITPYLGDDTCGVSAWLRF